MNRQAYTLIHEDDSILVVNKPAGLLTIPDRFSKHPENLYDILKSRNQSLHIVHRLDRSTSGILIFAKSEIVHRNLCQSFENREVKKIYLSICEGDIEPALVMIDQPIDEHPVRKGVYRVHSKGKKSSTEVHVIERFKSFSLCKIHLHTGRTHQIRVHLQHIGHPILADRIYGNREHFYLSAIKGRKYQKSKNKTENPLLSRAALHAHSLEFVHPVHGDTLYLEAPLPKDMRACLNQFRKILKTY